MISKEEVYKIGVIGKAHGIKGEVLFHFDDDVFDRVEADYLVLEVDGILVPFFIEEYRFRNDSTALLKLEDIDTQLLARDLTGCNVYFPHALAADAGDDTITWHSLVGFDIVEAESETMVGRIAAIDDSTANVLFELADGTLIPATEDLITHIDTKRRIVAMTIPEGLLRL